MNKRFSRWSVLFLQYLKRDWKKIGFWVIGLGLFSGAYVPAFEEIAKGNGLTGMYETMQNPAMISMVGPSPVHSAADYTLGAMYANEMLLFCGLFAAVLSILHVVSHTRKEEDLGLAELIRSFRVGRQANSFAVLTETLLINLLLAGFTSGMMIAFQASSITVEGSLLFGFSVGAAGFLGGVIALFFAQVMPVSSSATGASLSLIGVMYLLRAWTDVSNSDLSMLNPLSWTYLTFPFTKNNWIPLLYLFLFSIVVCVCASLLEEHRDLNSGYFPESEGNATAKQSLLSIPGLFLRLNRGVIISWFVAFVIMGAAYGSIYGDMQDFLESNELMKQMFMQSGSSIEESFTSTIIMVLICLSAILPIAITNKLFSEEARGHLDQLFSTKTSRHTFYWTTISLAILAGGVATLLSAGALGVTALSVMTAKTSMTLSVFLAAGFNLFPTILFFIGLAGLFLGWAPKLGKISYVYLGYSFMLNYFGGILNLPDWFAKTAIQSWFPKLPTEAFDFPTFSTIMFISIGMIFLGSLGYRQRDLIID
ncbi:ABC transporter permease [Candidatus Enterococcus courvalinii]|uniref:Tetronasin resistance protein n=1 Tax=Candidatus Enterococcus courvalinii TaxID=2815329 RepID=A0ABS3I4E1_9ENTE|nr:tetronasin resistance protein [Enterococcus sp. MSG2901]MBO0482656.1 tetronasin resistance protein [Enterococcus sp. MSG2901]